MLPALLLSIPGIALEATEITFEDVTDQASLRKPLAGFLGHGAAWGDLDRDGDPDLFVGGFADRPDEEYAPEKKPPPNALFENLGDGTFRQITNSPVVSHARTSGAVFADLDNDGWPELIVGNNAKSKPREGRGKIQARATTQRVQLFKNDKGKMIEISRESGACPEGLLSARNVMPLDYDGDGLLDLLIIEDRFTKNPRSALYRNMRSIVAKLTKGEAPDSAQMNAKVREMISEALQSDGIEEIFKLGEDGASEIDIFGDDYLAKIEKVKLPNTKIKLLQQLLKRAIEDFQKVNKIKAVDFTKQFQSLVNKYNERDEQDVLVSNVLDDFAGEIVDLFHALKKEKESFGEMGIDFEEKSFYDILKTLAHKYDLDYPEDKLIKLAKEVKTVVDDKAKYTDWSQRADIKAELKVDLIILLAENGYPPVDRDEVYKEIFEQAENFKKYQSP